jgi:hypothetical protein
LLQIAVKSRRNGPGKRWIPEEIGCRRRITRRAGVAGRKGHGRNNVATGAPKGRTDEKRPWKGPECNIGIKDPGTRRQLRLKIERTSDGFDRKAFGLQFVKRAAGMPSGLREVRNWTL